MGTWCRATPKMVLKHEEAVPIRVHALYKMEIGQTLGVCQHPSCSDHAFKYYHMVGLPCVAKFYHFFSGRALPHAPVCPIAHPGGVPVKRPFVGSVVSKNKARPWLHTDQGCGRV